MAAVNYLAESIAEDYLLTAENIYNYIQNIDAEGICETIWELNYLERVDLIAIKVTE